MNQRGEAEARRLEASMNRLFDEIRSWQQSDLYVSPAAGEWTAMENLAHLVEIQPYWAREVRKVIAQPGQPFGRTMEDPDRIAAVERGSGERLEEVVPRLRASMEEAVATLRSLDDQDWTKTGIHSRRGEMDLAAIVEFFLVGHVEEHVDQAIQAIQAARQR